VGLGLISKNHSNRGSHNWPIYDISDRFLEKFNPLYKGVLYDLGAGESPYKEFFLRYAEKYVSVDWSGCRHDSKADIAADLNEPLPINSDAADTVFSVFWYVGQKITPLLDRLDQNWAYEASGYFVTARNP